MIGEFSHYDRKYLILVKTKDNSSGKVLIELFQKVMLACGKLRLCLVGSRLHFPSENRQSRARTESF